jgi:hypothetical protein
MEPPPAELYSAQIMGWAARAAPDNVEKAISSRMDVNRNPGALAGGKWISGPAPVFFTFFR